MRANNIIRVFVRFSTPSSCSPVGSIFSCYVTSLGLRCRHLKYSTEAVPATPLKIPRNILIKQTMYPNKVPTSAKIPHKECLLPLGCCWRTGFTASCHQWSHESQSLGEFLYRRTYKLIGSAQKEKQKYVPRSRSIFWRMAMKYFYEDFSCQYFNVMFSTTARMADEKLKKRWWLMSFITLSVLPWNLSMGNDFVVKFLGCSGMYDLRIPL